MWILRGVCLTIIMVFSFQNGFISKYLSASFWSVLGEISFSFYLIHYLVLMWVTEFILMNNLEKNVFVVVSGAIGSFVMCLALSWIINRFWEHKLTKWMKSNLLLLVGKRWNRML